MTSPLFELVYGRKARASGELGKLNEEEDEPPFHQPSAARTA
jgi:hypothetical protein